MRRLSVPILFAMGACTPVTVPIGLDLPLPAVPAEPDAAFWSTTGVQSFDTLLEEIPEDLTGEVSIALTHVELRTSGEALIGSTVDEVYVTFSDDAEESEDDLLLAEFRAIEAIDPALATEVRQPLVGDFAIFLHGTARSTDTDLPLVLHVDLAATVTPNLSGSLVDALP